MSVVIKGSTFSLVGELAECKNSFHISTVDKNTMDELVEKLNDIALAMDFLLIETPLTYSYETKVGDSMKDCDWEGMTEMKINPDVLKKCKITVEFKLSKTEYKTFYDLFKERLNIKPTLKSSRFWFPERPSLFEKDYESFWVDDVKNKYPIYIISKGRWEKRYTSKYLEWAELDYKIVIEPREYEQYSAVIDPAKILLLPDDYLNKNQGGIPARNFVLAHSRSIGAKRHWILDDNIKCYTRFYNNQRINVKGGSAFRTVEDFADRYENLKLCGHQYRMFVPPLTTAARAYIKNTRIYSSILISNDITHEWRGKYNEDTDLSLRVLKDGDPTLLFNCFLADKEKTLSQKGGNTDSIYVDEGLKLKTLSLYEQHPDVCKVGEKFGRIHHIVDYRGFKKNKLIKKEIIEPCVDYNLRLVPKSELPFWWKNNG